MFEQSLLESAGAARSHRGLATSISALGQLTLLGIAVLLPMIFTQTMPLLKQRVVEAVPLPRTVPPPERPAGDPTSRQSGFYSTQPTIVVNNPFPTTHSLVLEHASPNPEIPQLSGIASMDATRLLIGNSDPSHVIRGPGKPLIISNLSEGRIIRKVTPTYPVIAKNSGIEGQVILEAVISRAGRIENLRLVSGHPWLVRAAEAAVSQWEFRPYILNGVPIEVMTQITVDFKLNRE